MGFVSIVVEVEARFEGEGVPEEVQLLRGGRLTRPTVCDIVGGAAV